MAVRCLDIGVRITVSSSWIQFICLSDYAISGGILGQGNKEHGTGGDQRGVPDWK